MATLEMPEVVALPGRQIMKLDVTMRYWQGLWTDDADHNLSFYLQRWNPRLARMIQRHQNLQLAWSFLRKCCLWFVLLISFCNSTVVYPTAIFVYWDDKKDVLDSSFALALNLTLFLTILSEVFQMDNIKHIIDDLEQCTREMHLDNEEQKLIVARAHVVCGNSTKFLYFVVGSSFVILDLVYTFVSCLPSRKQFFCGWYPYDVSASPAFEITLIGNAIYFLLASVQINICISTNLSLYIILRRVICGYADVLALLFILAIVSYGGTLLILNMNEEKSIKELCILLVGFEINIVFLILCNISETIAGLSSEAGNAAFASDWFGASTNFKSSMCILMTRANLPVHLEGTGVGKLSLAQFLEVSKVAYKMTASLEGIVK